MPEIQGAAVAKQWTERPSTGTPSRQSAHQLQERKRGIFEGVQLFRELACFIRDSREASNGEDSYQFFANRVK